MTPLYDTLRSDGSPMFNVSSSTRPSLYRPPDLSGPLDPHGGWARWSTALILALLSIVFALYVFLHRCRRPVRAEEADKDDERIICAEMLTDLVRQKRVHEATIASLHSQTAALSQALLSAPPPPLEPDHEADDVFLPLPPDLLARVATMASGIPPGGGRRAAVFADLRRLNLGLADIQSCYERVKTDELLDDFFGSM